MSYAVIKTGGKQYRVEEGTTLLVERLPDDEGAKVALEPLLYAGDQTLFGATTSARSRSRPPSSATSAARRSASSSSSPSAATSAPRATARSSPASR